MGDGGGNLLKETLLVEAGVGFFDNFLRRIVRGCRVSVLTSSGS